MSSAKKPFKPGQAARKAAAGTSGGAAGSAASAAPRGGVKLSLAQQIAFLSNPTPKDFDPEDEDGVGATFSASRSGVDPDALSEDEDAAPRLMSERSRIRKNFDVEDISAEYRGRVVSRKQLTDFPAEDEDEDEEEDGEDAEDGEDEDEEDDEALEDDEEDEDEGEDDELGEDDEEQEDQEDEDDEDGEGGTKAMLAKGLSDQQRMVQQQLAALEAEDADAGAALFQPRGAKGDVAPSSATSQYTKSLHMQNQLNWYTQLLNLRIRVQGVVAAANRLPASADVAVADQANPAVDDAAKAVSVRARFEAAEPAVAPAYSTALRGARKLLDELFDLQHELMQQNARLFAAKADADEEEDIEEDEEALERIPRWQGVAGSKRRRDDGEAPSDEEDDDVDEDATTAAADEQQAIDGYWSYLSQELTPYFRPIQDALIDKWNTKTQISAGQVAGGAGAASGSAFGQSGLAAAAAANKGGLKAINQSVLSQIDQLMLDETRLVRRSQLHRSATNDAHALLGRVEAERTRAAKRARRAADGVNLDYADPMQLAGGEEEEQYDGAIYDDNDYYQQLLAEIIAAATSAEMAGTGGLGGGAAGHDAAQLAKAAAAARKRGKRAGLVDRRASKGRKLRYVVHAKLANFMAPRAAPISDDFAARSGAAAAGASGNALTGSGFALDELFVNLFGGQGRKTLTAEQLRPAGANA